VLPISSVLYQEKHKFSTTGAFLIVRNNVQYHWMMMTNTKVSPTFSLHTKKHTGISFLFFFPTGVNGGVYLLEFSP